MDCHVISLLLFFGTLPRQYPLLDDFLYLLRVLLDFVSCSYRVEKLGYDRSWECIRTELQWSFGHGIQEMPPLKSEISGPENTYVRFQIKNSSLNAVDLEREKFDSLFINFIQPDSFLALFSQLLPT